MFWLQTVLLSLVIRKLVILILQKIICKHDKLSMLINI